MIWLGIRITSILAVPVLVIGCTEAIIRAVF